ncbi:MAG: amino acid ABC transporter permease [Erysipelotrichales bacterium]
MFLADISKLYDFSFLANKGVLIDFFKGLGTTMSIALFGVIIGIIIGIILAIFKLSNSKILRGIATSYINFVRGTPLILQMYFIFYVPALINPSLDFPPFLAGVVAVGLNSAAYVAEIFRGGILSVDKGQTEAARSLGLNHKKTLSMIIVPQAFKTVLPSLGNEFINVIKETAIISVIGAHDLMYYGKQAGTLTLNPYPGLILAGVMYFVVVYILTKLVGLLERRLQND